MQEKHNNDFKVEHFFKYLIFTMLVITALTLFLFRFIDILPSEYFFVLCILLLSVLVFLSILILSKKKSRKRVFGIFLSIIYVIVLIMTIIYELNTIGFLKKLGYKNYKTENYSVLVIKDNYHTLNDLNNKKIGYLEFNNNGKLKLEKQSNFDFQKYDDVLELKTKFLEKEIDGILVEKALMGILSLDDAIFNNSYESIYDFSIDIETKDTLKKKDIINDSFNIYLTGIDTYDDINSVGCSDINMIITVNPREHKILLTSLPRDYYVLMSDKKDYEKLTNTSIFGVQTSIGAIEELIGIDINYYVKINFISLIKLVDLLDGVSVHSEYTFVSKDGFSYQKGINNLNGAEALSFVREKDAFLDDNVRMQNGVYMLLALTEKVSDPSVIIKYNSLLDSLEKTFVTNLEMNDITKFIKKIIDDDIPSWNIDTQFLDGVLDSQYTYLYKSKKQYVVNKNLESIESIKEKIKNMY